MSTPDAADETPDVAEADSGPTVFTVTYAGETKDYDLIVSGMTFGEARAFEKVSGHTFAEIMSKPQLRDTTTVLQALIWVSMKRKIPTLTFGDLDDIAIDSIEWPEPAPPPDGGPVGGEAGPTSAGGGAPAETSVA